MDSYLQSDIDPGGVRSIIFLCYEGGKVADIIPVYETKILPDACTAIEDVKKLIDQWPNRHPEDKMMSPHVPVVIDII